MSTSLAVDQRHRDGRFTKLTLRTDAAASGALGILLAGFGPALQGPLGLPRALAVGAGGFLVLWTVALLIVGHRPKVSRTALTSVIAVNVCWVLASLFLLQSSAPALTGLGVALVIVQAGAVAAFAGLQVLALRRST